MTKGDKVGRSHIQCTEQAVKLIFRCDGALVFDDESTSCSPPSSSTSAYSGEALRHRGDRWHRGLFGATGALTDTDISTANETAALYEADVALPHN